MYSERALAIASNYPDPVQPQRGTFTKALFDKFQEQGVGVDVVAPLPFYRPSRGVSVRATTASNMSVVYPRYLSFSNRRVGGMSFAQLSNRMFARAAFRETRARKGLYEYVYGHFLYPSGLAVQRISRWLELPSFVALGEGDLSQYARAWSSKQIGDLLNSFDGVVCCSQENRQFCLEFGGVAQHKILLSPNAADTTKFCLTSTASARRALRLPQDVKIVLFVGHFNENKGAYRVLDAIRRLDGIYGVFLGGGSGIHGERVLAAKTVAHSEVQEWMAAADLFVLPTIRECSSNAIAEALACGLPVITSDLTNLRSITSPDCARLVDPISIDAIAEAIAEVMGNDSLRARMSNAARLYAERNSLDARSCQILRWIRSRSNK